MTLITFVRARQRIGDLKINFLRRQTISFPASKASREVANMTKRKNLIPAYIDRVRLKHPNKNFKYTPYFMHLPLGIWCNMSIKLQTLIFLCKILYWLGKGVGGYTTILCQLFEIQSSPPLVCKFTNRYHSFNSLVRSISLRHFFR